MWNNSFGIPSNFQNFNPEDFQNMPFGGLPSQPHQYYHHGMMQMNQQNDADPMDGEYQPSLGFPNQVAFAQNQNIGASFSSPPSMNDQNPQSVPALVSPRVPTQMNARAAQLKAELLKRKGERTPPVHAPVTSQSTAPTERSEHAASKSQRPTDNKREQDLHELISQYSAPRSTIGATIKQDNNPNTVTSIEQMPTSSTTSSQVNNGKAAKSAPNSKPQNKENKAHVLESRNTSRSVSEGEILEDITEARAAASTQAKNTQEKEKVLGSEERLPRTSREDHSVKPQFPRPSEETRCRSPSATQSVSALNGRADRRDEADKIDRRRNTSDSITYQGNQRVEPERKIYPRRDSRNDENRPNGALVRAESRTIRESYPPTLKDILELDEDLREWLEITGYHNEPYRNKILNRRRAIAALDAQREKLLAEMAAEERGIPPTATLPSTPSMLPPPTPNKVESHVDPMSTASFDEPQRASNKRPYSEVQDASHAPNTEKIARVDDRCVPSRNKDQEINGPRRPRSSGDSGHFSPARHGSSELRQRFEGRPRSRERDSSPGRRAYDSRLPARSRGYESESYFNRDDASDRHPKDNYGRYNGKDFDSDYRGRGSSRSRGRGRGEFRDSRDYQHGGSDYKNDSPFGSKIATRRPYRDPNGFDQGGRGDTRYFIVKSFNEENVLKCIEDSVWTTQVQNGPVFKEAFESCKNVILVFSINKSRAFQGYARMESLPGSVEVPQWQRAINWESAGAFKWLVICATRFHRIGHLKNSYNENQAVLIGKDGQEIEEACGAGLIELIDEEADQTLGRRRIKSEERDWDSHY